MAKKVETIKFKYRNRKGIVEMPVEVMLSADFDFYYAKRDITQELKDFFPDVYDYGKDQIYFDTFNELKETIRAMLAKFEKTQIEVVKEKVILYKMKINGNLTPHLYEDQRGSRQFSELGENADNLMGFALEWELGWKCKSGKTVTWHYHEVNDSGPDADGAEVVGRECNYGDAPSSKGTQDKGGRLAMPWTQEREDWFKNLQGTLRKMLINIDEFFNRTKPKDLIQIIDQKGVPQLSGRAEEDTES